MDNNCCNECDCWDAIESIEIEHWQLNKPQTKRIIMTETKSPIRYLKDNLSINGDFLQQWRKLDNKDREELKELAEEEINKSESKND